MAISNIQNFNAGGQIVLTGGAPAEAAPVAEVKSAEAQGALLASPAVTNFAQGMAEDGGAIKSLGAEAMDGLFGEGGGQGAMPPMGPPPSSNDTGWDNDRAIALLSEKIGAGKKTGDDLFAAQIASSGEE